MPVKGNKTPKFTLKIGAATATDFGAELRAINVDDGEGEQTTFADFASGNTPKAITIEADLSFGTTALFDYLWTNAGAANVSYELIADGAGTVSATNPKFTGTLTLPAKPNFGLAAGNDKQSFEATFQLDSMTKAVS